MSAVLEGVVKAGSILLAVLWAGLAPAQSYPAKPIRVIIGYSAGGPTDVLGRIVAQKVSANIGQTMVVENRPGANSIIGTELVAKAPPDGYTIMLASIGHPTRETARL